MPQLDPTEYERATAIVTHTTLNLSVSQAFPEFMPRERDELIINVINRLARMRGYAIRPWYDDDASKISQDSRPSQ